LAVSAENHVDELDVDSEKRVISALGARLRSARLSATEECVEDVAHVAEAGHTPETRSSTHVVIAALFRVTEHIKRVGDCLESLLGVVGRVYVGVKFPREFAIRLFDLILTRVAFDAEHFVMVH
jgi:hypothetical protein